MEISRGSQGEQHRTNQGGKLADVFSTYSHMLASSLYLDIDEIIEAKLEKNNIKYPVDKSKGNKEKYTELS